MHRPGATSRAATRPRQPLGDATSRANALHPLRSHPPQGKSLSLTPDPSSTDRREPVREPSREPATAAAVPPARSFSNAAENKRLSAVTDENCDSKRSSQVSTTSTNASSKGRRRKTHIGPWLLGSDIGNGGCGKVRKVKHSLTGQVAAAKIISKQRAETARAESLANLVEAQRRGNGSLGLPNKHVMPFGVEREVVIMKLLEHPNIVQLYDVWENRSELYLIMEHVDGGELFDYVERVSYLREDEAVWVFRQVVAALLHCHRLGIHHRDLKPENILLDLSAHPQAKLIDFGMAALQPQGQRLTTPCGSIHYAAPEVFERSYDGSKVDVWSLGVILYVMLTGNTPFAYDAATMKNDTDRWYRLIKSGRFAIPDSVSPEAADLIRRMLVPDPQQRITLEACWHHNLVQTYNQVWSNDPRENTLEYWVGSKPVIENWSIRTRADIDLEILVNLRCLWHSVDEEHIVKMILNKDPNQEKYFYSVLQKHRDEQLENYVGTIDAMGHSPSDYHHVKAPTSDELPPVPASAYNRTRSHFSIMDDRDANDAIQSRSSLKGGPSSVASYDPYRASRDTLIDSKGNYNVTLLRGHSAHSRRRSQTSVRMPTASLRVSTQRSDGRRSSMASSKTSLRGPSPSALRARSRSRSVSRMSLGSRASFYTSSPRSAVSRHKVRVKRPTTLTGSRRTSTTSLQTTRPNLVETSSAQSPEPKKKSHATRTALHTPLQASTAQNSTPPLRVINKSPRDLPTTSKSHIRVRKQRTQSQVLESEARKVSTELEKYCEEVFYRSSSHSSRGPPNAGTPPRSVSTPHDNATQQPPPSTTAGLSDTPNTYLARELAETRRRLTARYANDDAAAASSSYHEALAHLDSMLNVSSRSGTSGHDPARFLERMEVLPMISEESRAHDTESEVDFSSRSAPKGTTTLARSRPAEPTVRIVDHSLPPTRPAPLVIRKGSGATMESGPSDTSGSSQRYYSSKPPTLASQEQKPHKVSTEAQQRVSDGSNGPGSAAPEPKASKRRGWFARKRDSSLEDSEQKSKYDEDHSSQSSDAQGRSGNFQTAMAPALKGPPHEKSGFFAFLRKKRSASGGHRLAMGGDEDDLDPSNSFTAVSVTSRGRRTLQPSEAQKRIESRDLGVQQNWFTRFFKIRPASRILCFRRGRGIARQEMVRLLRSWRPYGIKDVVLDRNRNLIWGRLDSPNYMGIKEVQFVIELFVVLEYGRRAHLSLARFTQRSGAASSFRKVVDTIDSVLRGKGLLVESENRRREMEAILNG